ncbi:radical SAM family heme chaperone HemW [Desulfatitalea tepidiphila]|uniref:radical SAM family heme chaperone HemW n=1 Tax=Desulfatitalea tepidiphila TaxID=1185843 RepID=UPI0006B52A26|nr:radical SAM family heme chaperone HemW [Desulfatitalea tepidiphila]
MRQQENDTKADSGIYVHIPFCQSKCPYCDFYSIIDTSRIPEFLKALKVEMKLAATTGTRADTLYIGGGTPSLLTPKQMGLIVDWAAACFNLDPTAEMTLEINPATATKRDLQDYAAFGFNRLNIGVQSFNDQNLAFLGRRHSADQALAAVRAGVEAGFTNIGLDLIFGLPDQSTSTWKNDLLQAIRLAPKHLACYMLSYEPHTPLHQDMQSGRVVPLSELRTADLFRMTHDFLGVAGYEHYEVSNYAQNSRWRSKHNQKYWNFVPYIGLGPSAHSFNPPERRWNHRFLDDYLKALSQGQLPVSDQEHLSEEQQMIESLFLGLRQSDGIDFIRFQNRFHSDFKLYFHTALDRFSAEGWIEIDDQRCRLTVEGMLFLDRIVEELVDMIN